LDVIVNAPGAALFLECPFSYFFEDTSIDRDIASGCVCEAGKKAGLRTNLDPFRSVDKDLQVKQTCTALGHYIISDKSAHLSKYAGEERAIGGVNVPNKVEISSLDRLVSLRSQIPELLLGFGFGEALFWPPLGPFWCHPVVSGALGAFHLDWFGALWAGRHQQDHTGEHKKRQQQQERPHRGHRRASSRARAGPILAGNH